MELITEGVCGARPLRPVEKDVQHSHMTMVSRETERHVREVAACVCSEG
jgi:hypothetical protein